MFDKIKEDINQPAYLSNYSNDGQRFIAWYLINIHKLDHSEAKGCITDGANDKQIDAVYIDDNESKIYIIQGKYYSDPKVNAEPLREIISSWIQLKNLEQLQNNGNEKLKRMINEISRALDDEYDLILQLVTTSKLTNNANDDKNTFQNDLITDKELPARIEVIDLDNLELLYNESLNQNKPAINLEFTIDEEKTLEVSIEGTKTVISAIPLTECIKIREIDDGSIFKKNVRQSLGIKNRVNKGIVKTLKGDLGHFFLYHNGITALCSKITRKNNKLKVEDINIVNGCQSLSTIKSTSETIRSKNKNKGQNGYLLFKFFEITDNSIADNITKFTNTQSSVTARDIRSNDKWVKILKRDYQQRYPNGYFITKRGEEEEIKKQINIKYNPDFIVSLTDVAKQLNSWYLCRPCNSYNESKLFDKYFDSIFKHTYKPDCIQALNQLSKEIKNNWYAPKNSKDKDFNPLGLNETLLAKKSYAIQHHIYALSYIFNVANNKSDDFVPDPEEVYNLLTRNGNLNNIIALSGRFLNSAFECAYEESSNNNQVFAPDNWLKVSDSVKGIRVSINNFFKHEKDASLMLDSRKKEYETLINSLKIDKFEPFTKPE